MGAFVMVKRYLSAMLIRASRRKLHVVVLLGAIVILVTYSRSEDKGPITGSKYKLSILLFGERKLPMPSQTEINYMASNLIINYTILDNFISRQKMGQRGYHVSKLELYNKGSDVIQAKRWEMYAYIFHKIEPFSYPYPNGFYFKDGGLKVTHLGGNLYKFEPVGGYFRDIQPGESIHFKLKMTHFQVARTDSFPRWYVTAFDKYPRVIESTVGEHLGFVGPLLGENQVKRRIDDPFHPYSASRRYEMYRSQTGNGSIQKMTVLPTPLHFTVNEDVLIEWLPSAWFLIKNSFFAPQVNHLNKILKMKIVASKPTRKYLQFVKSPVKDPNGKIIDNEEAYSIKTDPVRYIITITASTNQGAFYGIQTLLSLVYSPEAASYVGVLISLPVFDIVDAPRFSYRGLHIDVARNYQDKDEMMKILDAMATYKMNKLHLHLTDDEGWRLEIPGLPELTQIGSKRCHDLNEEQCLLPQLGSGPNSNSSGSGYYSVRDYRDILKHAATRHIEVVPEFDMPGHSRAAIKSIHSKSQKFNRVSSGLPAFSIIEENDKSVYTSGQQFSDDAMNPCMTSTYVFVEKVMTEVIKMHEDIQPLKLYHFGGDEVAKGVWSSSDECDQLKENNPDLVTQYDLMAYFAKNVARLTAAVNISLGCWEDGMISHDKGVPFHRETFKNRDIYVYVWKHLKERMAPHRTRLFANTGYKVVLSHGAYLYFDHPYEPDPEERGLYWATRSLSTHTAWSYTPGLTQEDVGLDCPSFVHDKSNCYQLKKPENVVGIQAQVWTETIRTSDQLDYMLFPRLLAVAERAWHKGAWETEHVTSSDKKSLMKKEWTDFIKNVGNKELRRLGQMDINYRIPPPGALVTEGRVAFNSECPGLDTEYYSESDQMWRVVSHNMKITKPMEIRNRSPDGQRYSRTITVYPWDTSSSSSSLHHAVNFNYVLALSLIVTLFNAFANREYPDQPAPIGVV